MRIISVLGARPQFIKAAPASKAMRDAGIEEFLIHTGQHYDYGMSQVFFDELGLPEPDINLGIGSGSHGAQTGRMLIEIEKVLQNEVPDWVLVYGDTNSTLAGALAAVKLHIPVAHVEAGLRSFNREMPEEHNRLLTDHCADLLFCPTTTAVDNLAKEGIQHGVHLVGDTMYDAVLQFAEVARQSSTILNDLELKPKSYLLVTIHRPYNTDDPETLRGLLHALRACGETVVLPIHPRTRARIDEFGLAGPYDSNSNLRIINPVGYLDMLVLEQNARLILTDSGGIQKEAFFFCVPCITLRPETEWVETVESGWNRLINVQEQSLGDVIIGGCPAGVPPKVFGDGMAAVRIASLLSVQNDCILRKPTNSS